MGATGAGTAGRAAGAALGERGAAGPPARLRVRVELGTEWRRCRMERSKGRGGGTEENVGGVAGNW